MTDPEDFLSRWSRKKRDAVRAPTAPPPAAAESNVALDEATRGEPADAPPLTKATEAAFDPADLPSIDSIGAQTDVRAFLKAGVPPDLTRAALRRAWTADPAILNFKGLQENDWDFNDPNSMFGFGNLDPDFDVKRMLASVFGETPKEEAPAEATPESSPRAGEAAAQANDHRPDRVVLPPVTDGVGVELENSDATFDVRTAENEGVVQRTSDAASQRSDSGPTNPTLGRVRTHGGALPQ